MAIRCQEVTGEGEDSKERPHSARVAAAGGHGEKPETRRRRETVQSVFCHREAAGHPREPTLHAGP